MVSGKEIIFGVIHPVAAFRTWFAREIDGRFLLDEAPKGVRVIPSELTRLAVWDAAAMMGFVSEDVANRFRPNIPGIVWPSSVGDKPELGDIPQHNNV